MPGVGLDHEEQISRRKSSQIQVDGNKVIQQYGLDGMPIEKDTHDDVTFISD